MRNTFFTEMIYCVKIGNDLFYFKMWTISSPMVVLSRENQRRWFFFFLWCTMFRFCISALDKNESNDMFFDKNVFLSGRQRVSASCVWRSEKRCKKIREDGDKNNNNKRREKSEKGAWKEDGFLSARARWDHDELRIRASGLLRGVLCLRENAKRENGSRSARETTSSSFVRWKEKTRMVRILLTNRTFLRPFFISNVALKFVQCP